MTKHKAIQIGWLMLLAGCALVLSLTLWHRESQAQGDAALVLLQTIEVGGSPDAIVVDCWAERNDVLFYDRSSGKVRFIDGDTLTLLPQEITIPTWAWEGWMLYDHYHHHTYVVSMRSRETAMHVGWDEVRVHVVAGRSLLHTFSVNEDYNTDPLNPADRFYGLDGLALKQPMSEGNNPGRLIIDDTANGNIDVVDLNPTGTDAARRQRYSYRPSLCSESYCAWQDNQGNSLAVETNHETLAVDDLTSTDILYIADKNYSDGYGLRALYLHQPPQDLDATPLPDADLQNNCGIGGCQGIAMAGSRDILYVASGDQSFDRGYLGEVDTTDNQLANVVNLTYGDEDFVLVDWYDSRRVFVGTFDHWYNDPDQGLYLQLIYGGAVVDTLRLMTGYDEYDDRLRGMAFDPHHRRLYLSVGSRVMVVQVNYGAGPAPPAPIIASAVISPEGGSLDAPGNRAHLEFPWGAVDQTVVVTYTETGSSPAGDLLGVRFFDLSAVISGTTVPVTSFNKPYTITLNYTDAEKGPAIESTLGLYWWDGRQWIEEPSSRVDTEENWLMATPDHMSLFAMLGETRRGYLPVIFRNW